MNASLMGAEREYSKLPASNFFDEELFSPTVPKRSAVTAKCRSIVTLLFYELSMPGLVQHPAPGHRNNSMLF
ncbi:MAG TPA: hypothetical protein VJ765_05970 [Chitinophagaceae bacterium]|nr:hypothetical protein [Chitinophagaceae bacterium]